MKRLFFRKAKNGLITSREVNEARGGLILAAGRARSNEKKTNEKNEKKSAPPETPRNPQQIGDRANY